MKRKAASPYYLSLNVVGNLVAPTPSSDMSQVLEAGGGASLVFGRRINRYLAIEGSALVTFHRAGDIVSFNTGALAGFTIDARLFLSPRATRIQPYGLVGLGSYLLAREGLNDPLEGVGVQAGIGVDFQLNPMVSLGIKAVFRGAYLDNRFGDWSPFPAESAFISMVTTEAGLTIRL